MTDAKAASPFQIRPARADDIRPVARLWCDAFQGKRTVGDRIRILETGGRFGGLECVSVVADGDEVVGACKSYPMTEYIAGVAMPMMGLAAVAVIPARRRQGLAADLVTDAIRKAADRGDVISVLYPFRPDYYERLGWGLVGALHEYRFRTRALDPTDEVRHVRGAELERDAEDLAASYARVAARSNGPLERDRQVWAFRLSGEEVGVGPVDAEAVWTNRTEGKLRAVVYDDGGISGYALLRYIRKGSPEEYTLQVRELAAETEQAYRGLLGHIAGQQDAWPLCHYFARPDEGFGDRLSDPRPPRFRGARSLYFPTARIVRGPMLRVIDVPGALRLRRYFDGGRGRSAVLSVTVMDMERPENRGPWTVSLAEDGGAEVEEGAPTAPDAELETDAATLARIFAGDIPATDAARQGRAFVHGEGGLLDRAFATRERFWLLDEF